MSDKCDSQKGYALVTVLTVLVIATLLGVASMNTSTMETMMTANDKWHKTAYVGADAGLEWGVEILEQSIEQGPWDDNDIDYYTATYGVKMNNSTNSSGGTFYMNDCKKQPCLECIGISGGIRVADITYAYTYPSYNNVKLDSELWYVGNNATALAGAAMQMAAGYEGKGKGAGSGGIMKKYFVYSQHVGPGKGRSMLKLNWRHVTD